MSSNASEGLPDFGNSEPSPSSMNDRQEVFRALVELQDRGESVRVSRAHISAQFDISQEELAGIEREGISMNWPPL